MYDCAFVGLELNYICVLFEGLGSFDNFLLALKWRECSFDSISLVYVHIKAMSPCAVSIMIE